MARSRKPARAAANALAGLATAAAALLAAEIAARGFAGAPAPEAAPTGFSYAHLDAVEPFFAVKKVMAPRRPHAQPSQFDARKAPGTLRVFIVGGSVGQPFFSARTEAATALWRQAFPGKRLELVNASMGGYDSARDLDTVREVLGYEPDLVVVLSGNNEAAEPPLRRPRLAALNRALRRSALWSAAQDALAERRGKPDASAKLETNLRAMARAAKQAGVPLVLAALPTNLRDVVPAVEMPQSADFTAGWDAWMRGDARAALARWKRHREDRPNDAAGAYWLARALDLNARKAEAAVHYRAAADLEGRDRALRLLAPSNRCAPACAETIRRVAKEEGALVADLEALFASLADHGAPGLEHFRDACHWHDSYYAAVSLEILRAAAPLRADLTLLSEDRRWRRPRLEPGERDAASDAALRTGLAQALRAGRGPLDESALAQVELARRLSPDSWTRRTASPQALEQLLTDPDAGPSAEWLRAGAAAAPDVTWRYIDEARKRAGKHKEAA